MITTEPLVSIIMPAYNAGKFIAESIESAIAQTHTNWELIIVDDGSTDNTKDIAQQYCKKDLRIQYYWQPNAKAGKARNFALQHAAGMYTAFLDADDVWFNNKLQLQLQLLKEKNADLVFSDAYMFLKNSDETTKQMNSGTGFFSGEEGIKKMLSQNKVPTLTVLVKTEKLKAAGGFTESILIPQAEDYHLWFKLLMNGCIFFGSPEKLAAYRVHASSTSAADRHAMINVIEALQDLKNNHQSYKTLLTKYQQKWFVRYHHSTNNWQKKDYKNLIKKNCSYLNKAYLNLLFQTAYYFAGIKLTRAAINKLVNDVANYKTA